MKNIILNVSKENLDKDKNTIEVKALKGDFNSRILYVKLKDENYFINLNENDTALITYKNDIFNNTYKGFVNSQSGIIKFIIPNCLLSKAGEYVCAVTLFRDKKSITTFNFNLLVNDSLYSGDYVEDDENVPILNNLINDVNSSLENVEVTKTLVEKTCSNSKDINENIKQSLNDLKNKESLIVSNELVRKANEITRGANETRRENNEKIRIQSELDRNKKFDDYIKNSDLAIKNLNNAVEDTKKLNNEIKLERDNCFKLLETITTSEDLNEIKREYEPQICFAIVINMPQGKVSNFDYRVSGANKNEYTMSTLCKDIGSNSKGYFLIECYISNLKGIGYSFGKVGNFYDYEFTQATTNVFRNFSKEEKMTKLFFSFSKSPLPKGTQINIYGLRDLNEN